MEKFKNYYENIEGWYNFEGLYRLLVKDLPDNSHIVEIGGWLGKSCIHLAALAKKHRKILG